MPELDFDRNILVSPDFPLVLGTAGRQSIPRTTEPHRHPQGQLIGSTRGLLTISTERGIWTIPATQAVWLPPDRLHWAKSHGPYEGFSLYVTPPACEGLPQEPTTIRISALLREAVLRAAAWSDGPTDAAALRLALVILDEIRASPVEPFALPLPKDTNIGKVALSLIDDPTSARSLEEWADVAVVSARTLSRRFVEQTGLSFSDWRQRARLLRSIEMLATDQPVSTIALDLGYATPSAFIAAFRSRLGETPSAYRLRL